MDFKQLLLEAIAGLYSTTVEAVARDIRAMPIAEENLNEFCEAMEDAGY